MHYKNGREARNGDKVVVFSPHTVVAVGILFDAVAGNDYCNGKVAPTNGVLAGLSGVNLKECLHLDDVLAALPAVVPDSTK